MIAPLVAGLLAILVLAALVLWVASRERAHGVKLSADRHGSGGGGGPGSGERALGWHRADGGAGGAGRARSQATDAGEREP